MIEQKDNPNRIYKICLLLSFFLFIIGTVLTLNFFPVSTEGMSDTEIRKLLEDLAINLELGEFLMKVSWASLALTIICFAYSHMKKKHDQ